MTARCTSCGASYFFRATRGAKLADRKCSCGGKYEILSSAKPVQLDGQVLPDGGKAYDHYENGKPFVYPMKNRAGQLFLHDFENRIYKPFTP